MLALLYAVAFLLAGCLGGASQSTSQAGPKYWSQCSEFESAGVSHPELLVWGFVPRTRRYDSQGRLTQRGSFSPSALALTDQNGKLRWCTDFASPWEVALPGESMERHYRRGQALVPVLESSDTIFIAAGILFAAFEESTGALRFTHRVEEPSVPGLFFDGATYALRVGEQICSGETGVRLFAKCANRVVLFTGRSFSVFGVGPVNHRGTLVFDPSQHIVSSKAASMKIRMEVENVQLTLDASIYLH